MLALTIIMQLINLIQVLWASSSEATLQELGMLVSSK